MRHYIYILLVLLSINGQAQDIHHTMYWLTPSNANSALVGETPGTTLGILHRNQYFSSIPNLFIRNSIVVDHSFSEKIGIGLNLHHSKSGSIGTKYNSAQGFASYKISLGTKNYIRIGGRVGLGKFENSNLADLRLETSILGLPTTEFLPSNRPFSYRFGTGIIYKKTINNGSLQLGYDTRYNLLYSLNLDQYILEDRWLNIYTLSYQKPINKYTNINISSLYQTLGNAYELQASVVLESKTSLKRNDALLYGIGYRYKDAIQYIIGYRFKSYTAMLGYDQIISNLAQANNGIGAIELGFIYNILPEQKRVLQKMLLTNYLPRLPINLISPAKITSLKLKISSPIKSFEPIRLVSDNLPSDKMEVRIRYGSLDTIVVMMNSTPIDLPNLEKATSLLVTTEEYTDISIDLNNHSTVDKPYYLIDFNKKKSPISFDPIYYDFDLSIIRNDQEHPLDKIYNAIVNDPSLIIQFDAFTDNRGSKNYNLDLSKSRSIAAKEYLTNKGISPDRIITYHHGELDPVIDCSNSECTEAQHSLNRRTEVKIVRR